MLPAKDISGIILAGGKSSRMGTEKGLVLWNGIPFIQHSINAMRPLVRDIVIVSNHGQYDLLGQKRIPDRISNAGPVSGLYSGLVHSTANWNLVLSCDVPLIKSDVLSLLISQHREEAMATICVANHKLMPLVGLYDKQCSHWCKKLLDRGEKRMMRLIDEIPSVNYVVLSGERVKSVKNINSLKDLKEIENAN